MRFICCLRKSQICLRSGRDRKSPSDAPGQGCPTGSVNFFNNHLGSALLLWEIIIRAPGCMSLGNHVTTEIEHNLKTQRGSVQCTFLFAHLISHFGINFGAHQFLLPRNPIEANAFSIPPRLEPKNTLRSEVKGIPYPAVNPNGQVKISSRSSHGPLVQCREVPLTQPVDVDRPPFPSALALWMHFSDTSSAFNSSLTIRLTTLEWVLSNELTTFNVPSERLRLTVKVRSIVHSEGDRIGIDAAVHPDELDLRAAVGGHLRRLLHLRDRHAQSAALLLRGILRVPVLREPAVPAVRVHLPAARARHRPDAAEAHPHRGAQDEDGRREGSQGGPTSIPEHFRHHLLPRGPRSTASPRTTGATARCSSGSGPSPSAWARWCTTALSSAPSSRSLPLRPATASCWASTRCCR
ncbi:hypothetical protein CEXT_778151 [Caerostris extrusa]|uniref:Uncharacterized protein n=1 Tax=Caerostris extrusa TaxID=172846 RepID=A0AAV4R9C1_CAEEX|nr:hypothetical protein CEXT_778151 [Caerostris extrusa]